MVQELPAFVVVTIGNEGAKPGVCTMLGLLPLVRLQVDISQASPDTQIGEIGLAAIPQLEGSTVECTMESGCRHSWRREQSLPTMRQPPLPGCKWHPLLGP
jgi:hypothetical protein